MAAVKLTKNELRDQQHRLNQLNKYLPTLQLKKAMLQHQANEVRAELLRLEKAFNEQYDKSVALSRLLTEYPGVDVPALTQVKEIHKRYENIAGVEIPYYEGVKFEEMSYQLFDTPPWLDGVIRELRSTLESRIKVDVGREKKEAVEKELREVSIRVNLFEKILIPRALENIKKIKVFLGDQLLAAVSRAKVAKKKIEAHNEN